MWPSRSGNRGKHVYRKYALAQDGMERDQGSGHSRVDGTSSMDMKWNAPTYVRSSLCNESCCTRYRSPSAMGLCVSETSLTSTTLRPIFGRKYCHLDVLLMQSCSGSKRLMAFTQGGRCCCKDDGLNYSAGSAFNAGPDAKPRRRWG